MLKSARDEIAGLTVTMSADDAVQAAADLWRRAGRRASIDGASVALDAQAKELESRGGNQRQAAACRTGARVLRELAELSRAQADLGLALAHHLVAAQPVVDGPEQLTLDGDA